MNKVQLKYTIKLAITDSYAAKLNRMSPEEIDIMTNDVYKAVLAQESDEREDRNLLVVSDREKLYTILNATDGIVACPDNLNDEAALNWVHNFRKSLDEYQGFYLTSSQERISVEDVVFKFIPIN